MYGRTRARTHGCHAANDLARKRGWPPTVAPQGSAEARHWHWAGHGMALGFATAWHWAGHGMALGRHAQVLQLSSHAKEKTEKARARLTAATQRPLCMAPT